MIHRKKDETPSQLDEAISAAHEKLKTEDETDRYDKMVDNLSKLYKMKEATQPLNRVSKDAVVAACASFGSVALILIFEGVGRGIITSKALGFAPKAKI